MILYVKIVMMVLNHLLKLLLLLVLRKVLKIKVKNGITNNIW